MPTLSMATAATVAQLAGGVLEVITSGLAAKGVESVVPKNYALGGLTWCLSEDAKDNSTDNLIIKNESGKDQSIFYSLNTSNENKTLYYIVPKGGSMSTGASDEIRNYKLGRASVSDSGESDGIDDSVLKALTCSIKLLSTGALFKVMDGIAAEFREDGFTIKLTDDKVKYVKFNATVQDGNGNSAQITGEIDKEKLLKGEISKEYFYPDGLHVEQVVNSLNLDVSVDYETYNRLLEKSKLRTR